MRQKKGGEKIEDLIPMIHARIIIIPTVFILWNHSQCCCTVVVGLTLGENSASFLLSLLINYLSSSSSFFLSRVMWLKGC